MNQYHYLVTYDICAPSRLRVVHKICSSFGIAIQFSVFACRLNDKQLESMKAKISDAIKPSQDQVIFLKIRKLSKNTKSNEIPGIQSIGREITWKNLRAIII